MRDRTQSRDFLLLGMGSSFNGFGMSGEQVIVGLLIFESTGTSAWVGVSLAIYFAPMFFFGAPAGALADTVDRRRMLAVLEVLEFAVLVVLGIAITFGFDTLAILLPLAFASGTIRAFHHPAKLGYAFDLSGPGRVVSTLGRLNVITRTGQLLGAVLAGTVAGQVSPQAGIFLIACGHLVGAMALGRMRTPGRSREARVESPWQTLVDYARELRENQSLRTLVVVICGMEVFGYSYMTLATGNSDQPPRHWCGGFGPAACITGFRWSAVWPGVVSCGGSDPLWHEIPTSDDGFRTVFNCPGLVGERLAGGRTGRWHRGLCRGWRCPLAKPDAALRTRPFARSRNGRVGTRYRHGANWSFANGFSGRLIRSRGCVGSKRDPTRWLCRRNHGHVAPLACALTHSTH